MRAKIITILFFALPMLLFAQAPKPIPTKNISVNGVVFKMVKVESGSFQMGATTEQGSTAKSDEKPAHMVTLKSYYIAETPVTQELWQSIMDKNPSHTKGSSRPVESVSWDDCQQFIAELNRLSGKKFRLPTEAEWEFAARGGNLSKGYKYAGSADPDKVAWNSEISSMELPFVKTKDPNELGIYDMNGGVWEWCSDWYGYYQGKALVNPQGPYDGSYRVMRGGSYKCEEYDCRISTRKYGMPYDANDDYGLRLVLDAE